jgi:hypothetical protein
MSLAIALSVLFVIIVILAYNIQVGGSGWLTAFLVIGGLGVISYYLYTSIAWDVVKSYFQSRKAGKNLPPTEDESAKILSNLEDLNEKNPKWYEDTCGESMIDYINMFTFADLANPSEENLQDDDFKELQKDFNAAHYVVLKQGNRQECINVKEFIKWISQKENQRVDAEEGGQISAASKYNKQGIDFYKSMPHNILVREWQPILENPDTRMFELVDDGMSKKLYSVSALSHIRHVGEVHGTHPPEHVYKLVPVH